VNEIEQRLAKLPGVQQRFTTIGKKTGRGQGDVTRASVYLRIKDLGERSYSQFDVMKRARSILKDYPDLRTAVNDVSAIGGGRSSENSDTRNFNLLLKGPGIAKLAECSETLKQRLSQIPGLLDVDSTLSLRKPELQVAIDRDRASDLGIPVETIATTLRVLAARQAEVRDDFHEQEPGKILHELRFGELTARGERPHSPYYGSADATPLFLILLDEYQRWSGDDELVRALEPHRRRRAIRRRRGRAAAGLC